MVEVAYHLMSTRGYAQTTMAVVAAQAGVAVQTVYFTFHNKPGLLRAAYEFAVLGDHLPVPPQQRPWFSEMEKELDFGRALMMAVDATAEILKRVTPLASVVQMLGDDPEISAFQQLSERLRREGYGQMVEVLALKRDLRPGLSRDDATTILLVLLGPDVYRAMVIDHRWGEENWRRWITQTVAESLFGSQPVVRGTDAGPRPPLPHSSRARSRP
jgi:AcrR family transcriptional regulator